MSRASIRTGLAAAVALAGLVGVAPPPALASAAPPCHADDLSLSKAGQEAAAGSRYLDIRIRNVTGGRCRLTGFPVFTWRRHGHDLGWASVPEAGQTARTVVIEPGRSAFTTLHWVDPGPVPAAECRPRRTTGLHMTLPYRSHVYRFAIRARVCTTQEYRPTAFPVRSGRVVS
jgi:hypothetical protein